MKVTIEGSSSLQKYLKDIKELEIQMKEKFVEEMGEEVYDNYTKESSVKAQVRIKAKNES